MGAPARPPSPPAAPRPPPPPAGLTLARYLYVDDARTHEVTAGPRDGAWVTKEGALGSTEPKERVESVQPFSALWEARVLQYELESRLAALGRYWRNDISTGTWARVTAPATPAAGTLDAATRLDDAAAEFRLLHHPGGRDRVLVSLPWSARDARRFALVQFDFAFPDAENGAQAIIHPQLPQVIHRSLLLREHMQLASRGYHKLARPADFERALGADYRRDLDRCYHVILRRLSEGAPRPKPLEERPIDETYTDYRAALGDPRVAALHARFLKPGEEAQLVTAGDMAIRRFIQAKRMTTRRADQHLLTLLEASLLARASLDTPEHHVDPEVAALVRRFAYYL